jgi:pimeloyl-ACP methyl ester carboxylesterase
VSPLLRAAGHDVLAPTLTGVSDRAHVLSPQVGLDTHIQDVVSLIEAHDLDDVTLVGHSYGGQVITGVSDRIPDRISKRIHLDGFIGDGRSALAQQPAEIAHHYETSVHESGFGWLIPPRSLAKLGVTEQADLDWLTPRLTPHPWKAWTDELPLTGAFNDVTPAYVGCVDWMAVFQPNLEQAKAAGWDTVELQTGHEAMVTAPRELADALLSLVDTKE